MSISKNIAARVIPPCFRLPPKQRLIAKEGALYILYGLTATIVGGVIWGIVAALPLSVLTLYICAFFRNPHRPFLEGEGLIISPADGKVVEVSECEEPRYLKGRGKKVSIFMSPLNCHINRAPVEGEVLACYYKKGSYKAAFRKKAIEHNEHHAILMKDLKGDPWLVIQIAGFLARRIVSYVQGGETLGRGERFGLIQFGSRVDLYCPLHCQLFVKPGHKVKAGKTILGMGRAS